MKHSIYLNFLSELKKALLSGFRRSIGSKFVLSNLLRYSMKFKEYFSAPARFEVKGIRFMYRFIFSLLIILINTRIA